MVEVDQRLPPFGRDNTAGYGCFRLVATYPLTNSEAHDLVTDSKEGRCGG